MQFCHLCTYIFHFFSEFNCPCYKNKLYSISNDFKHMCPNSLIYSIKIIKNNIEVEILKYEIKLNTTFIRIRDK